MNLKQRVYEDYFKPSRLQEYEIVLRTFRDNGYQMIGILGFQYLVVRGGVTGKYFLNRHDIDTSPKVAREMFEIEKSVYGHEGASTYYFRNSTIDKKLISEIEKYGYETGYHYEELATYEKEDKSKNVAKIRESLPKCREMFLKDVEKFRTLTGSACATVASHGDFINTKYKVQNIEILQDFSIREKANILCEAYDDEIMKHVQARYADQVLLNRFSDEVLGGIAAGHEIIMTLTHPRNWKVDVIANTIDNATRFWQGLKYRI